MIDDMAGLFLNAVVGFVVDFLVACIGYWPGWIALMVLTWGRYPPPEPEKHDLYLVGSFGICVLIACIPAYFIGRDLFSNLVTLLA